ncbi:DUF397 domain-containing protein [Streptomyces beihaiensis]|uniref:DUF397 domain-containing protein n=1 Tax=Streptomyces beihaiensis TaxID=2984495 RepID=A0ABT3TUQ4_9ACTN|nr:DUF397 domain-containing protein [Streptomyces beihaiensis]MCX3060768.1 DUF397 domain-containing protein [Streptomyces beihaiensis]
MSNDTRTLRWFKSSYSNDSGGACLEVAYAWRKSSYSNDSGGNCVEVAACACHGAEAGGAGGAAATVHVRDSKDVALPGLAVSAGAWAAFVAETGGDPR